MAPRRPTVPGGPELAKRSPMRIRPLALPTHGSISDVDTPSPVAAAGPRFGLGRLVDLVRAAPKPAAQIRSAEMAGEGAIAALCRCTRAFDELHRGPVNSRDFEAAARRVDHFADQLDRAMAGGPEAPREDQALLALLEQYRGPSRIMWRFLNDRLEDESGQPRIFGAVDAPARATAAAVSLRAALARVEAHLPLLGIPAEPPLHLELRGPGLLRSLAIFTHVAPKLGPAGLRHELSQLEQTLADLLSIALRPDGQALLRGAQAQLREKLRERLDAALLALEHPNMSQQGAPAKAAAVAVRKALGD